MTVHVSCAAAAAVAAGWFDCLQSLLPMVKSDITLCTVFANGTPLTYSNTTALVSTAFVQY